MTEAQNETQSFRSDYNSPNYVRGYEIIPWVFRQAIVAHWMTGDYQGEWIIIAREAHAPRFQRGESGRYFIYKDWYGSCSGCDNFEATFDSDEIPYEQARAFAEAYPPFAVVPIDVARLALKEEWLAKLLPGNVEIGDTNLQGLITAWSLDIKDEPEEA